MTLMRFQPMAILFLVDCLSLSSVFPVWSNSHAVFFWKCVEASDISSFIEFSTIQCAVCLDIIKRSSFFFELIRTSLNDNFQWIMWTTRWKYSRIRYYNGRKGHFYKNSIDSVKIWKCSIFRLKCWTSWNNNRLVKKDAIAKIWCILWRRNHPFDLYEMRAINNSTKPSYLATKTLRAKFSLLFVFFTVWWKMLTPLRLRFNYSSITLISTEQ